MLPSAVSLAPAPASLSLSLSSPYRTTNQNTHTQELAKTRKITNREEAFQLPLTNILTSTVKPAATATLTASPPPATLAAIAARTDDTQKRTSSASKRTTNNLTASAGVPAASASWQSFGRSKLNDRNVSVARSLKADSAQREKTISHVRALDKEITPTVQYNTSARPSSGGVTLPRVGSASAAPADRSNTSTLFNRSTAAQTSVLSPVAGVDDPILHTHTIKSASGQTSLFTSQRLHDLTISKQQRHFDALNEYRDWRVAFDRHLNEQVDLIASRLRIDLDALEAPIKVLLFETMADPDRLLRMEVAEIKAAEREFHHNYDLKQRAIDAAMQMLADVELTRSAECRAALEKLVGTWLRVAHLPPAELERQLAQETKELNVHLLSNSSTAHELCAVLTAELVLKQREVNLRTWSERFEQWKQLRHEYLLKDFETRFEEDYPEPPLIDPITGDVRAAPLDERPNPFQYSRVKRGKFDEIMQLQREFASFGDERITALLLLNPTSEPADLKSKLDVVAEQMQHSYLVYDQQIHSLIDDVRQIESDLVSRAGAMVSELVYHLNEIGSKSPAGISSDLAERIEPLLTRRSEREAAQLEQVLKSLNYFDTIYLTCIDQCTNFFATAGGKWDEFLRALEQRNTFFAAALDEARVDFDRANADAERRLADEVALLAHAPSMAALDERLGVVRGLVGPDGEIEQLYRAFYQRSHALTVQHPLDLHATARVHSAGLAKQFGLQDPLDLLNDKRALEAAAIEAAAEAARLEEEEDAKLSKREKAKKEKLKKDKELADAHAAEQETKAKLAKIKAAQVAQAKAAKAAAAATPALDAAESTDPPSPSAASTGELTRSRSRSALSSPSAKPKKKSDAELLDDLAREEATAAATHSLEQSVTRDVFYSLSLYQHASFMASGVKLARETPLEELGLVKIQSGLLDEPSYVEPEIIHAETQLPESEVRKFILYPQPPAPIVEEPVKKTRRSASPFKVNPAPPTQTAPTPTEPTGPTVPTLVLPKDVLQFTVLLDHTALLHRILNGDPVAEPNAADSELFTFPPDTSRVDQAGRVSASPDLATARSHTGDAPADSPSPAKESKESARGASARARAPSTERPNTPDRATPTKGTKTKKKTAKELAKEEELARIQAEEEARALAAEEERLAAIQRAIEAIPTDSKGCDLLAPIVFPKALLSSRLDRVREAYLVSLEFESRHCLDLCESRNASIQIDLVKELNLSMRKYKTRINRIEVDVYEVRAKVLNGNLKQYNRFIDRLTSSYTTSLTDCENSLLRGEKELLLFRLRIDADITRLAELSKNPFGNLSDLNVINTELKQYTHSFAKTMKVQVFQPLRSGTDNWTNRIQLQIKNFLDGCRKRVFGGANAIDAALVHASPVDDADIDSPLVVDGASGESYHPDEVTYYVDLLTSFERGFMTLLVDRQSKIDQLQTKYDDIMKLTPFNAAYNINLQNLAIQQGLGHANGAPKRKLTVALRTEFNKSKRQEEFIDALLDEIERVQKGDIRPRTSMSSLSSLSSIPDSIVSPSSPPGVSSHARVGSMDDLARSFDQLQLATPTLHDETTITAHIFRNIDQLRRAMLARAQYLGAIKPGLPQFVMTEVAADPESAAALDDARKKAELAKKLDEDSKVTSRTKRLGSSDPSSTSPSGSATKVSKRASSKSLDDPVESRDANAATAPTFVTTCNAHVQECKKEMAALLHAYEAAYPDRKHAEQPKADSATEEKEPQPDEKKVNNAATKKKDADAKRKARRKGEEVPDTTAEPAYVITPAVEAHCASELQRSMSHLAASTAHLIAQSSRAAALLSTIGTTVFGDVFDRLVRSDLHVRLADVIRNFDARMVRWTQSAIRHREKLRPALKSRPERATLDLLEKEEARYEACVDGIRQHQRVQLAMLKDNSTQVLSHLLHATSTLLTLQDTMPLTCDLQNLHEPGEVDRQARAALEQRRAIAAAAGIELDAAGNVVPPIVGSNSAGSESLSPKLRVGSGKKKSSSQLAADHALASNSIAASEELIRSRDPRYLRQTWPGIKIDTLVVPEDEQTRKERLEKEREEQLASAAAAAAAALDDGKRRRRTKAATASISSDESVSTERSNPDSGGNTPNTGKSGMSGTTGSRRTKKQKQDDEAAAAALALASAAESAARLVETPSVTSLMHPSQRIVIDNRDELFRAYSQLFHDQVSTITSIYARQLAAEEKAHKEWNEQAQNLQRTETNQFETQHGEGTNTNDIRN